MKKMRDWRGNLHQVDILVRQDAVLFDGPGGEMKGFMVCAELDSTRRFCRNVWPDDDWSEARRAVLATVEKFLEGRFHPTHYDGEFVDLRRCD